MAPDQSRLAAQRLNTTTTGMDNSPFRKLPLELRLDIYELVLGQPEGLKLRHDGQSGTLKITGKTADRILSITATCREMRQENFLLPFKLNSFTVPAPVTGLERSSSASSTASKPAANTPALVGAWLGRLNKTAASSIRNLTIDLGEHPGDEKSKPMELKTHLQRIQIYLKRLREAGRLGPKLEITYLHRLVLPTQSPGYASMVTELKRVGLASIDCKFPITRSQQDLEQSLALVEAQFAEKSSRIVPFFHDEAMQEIFPPFLAPGYGIRWLEGYFASRARYIEVAVAQSLWQGNTLVSW